MLISCPQCAYATEIDNTLLPVGGMEGICPRCRSSISLGSWAASTESVHEAVPLAPSAADGNEAAYEDEHEGRTSIINIIALLFIIDSTLSLIGRVPWLEGVIGTGPELTFHQRAKYLYDTLMAAGFFISAFGIMARKNWARVSSIWLLGLGLTEGLYMLVYQYFAIAELEKNLQEAFPESRQSQNAKMVGCLLYAFFIVKLTSGRIKARFN